MFSQVLENSWNTFVRIYKEFSAESTIHGIKYTTAKSPSARFFWMIVLVLSVLTSAKLASLFYARHEAASISTLIVSDHFPSWRLSLPAITICSDTLVVAEKMMLYLSSGKPVHMPHGLTRRDFEHSMQYLRESIYPKNHFPDELDKLQDILTANNMSLLDLYQNVSPNCSDLMLMCRFEGKTVPCEDLVRSVVTPYGICCSFNYESPDEVKQRVNKAVPEYRSALFGENFILSFLIKSYTAKERVSSVINGDGIRVIVHERHTVPTENAEKYVAAAGYESIARISAVHSASSPDVLNLLPRTRGCMKSISPVLPYRSDNCYMRCRERAIAKLCGCVPNTASVGHGGQLCNLTHIGCLARIVLKIRTMTIADPDCACLTECDVTTYKMTVTDLALSKAGDNRAELYKKARKYGNVTIIHFTFATQTAILQRRELVLTKTNLIASLGGVFGLFLGCSFISLVEVIYFFCIHLTLERRRFRAIGSASRTTERQNCARLN